ncbi:Predicted site-specific integrase-resolvase [Allochromatium warmingii]|uniref:Predicted site-specific integrase-resolvase n=1 Tax=Allochromatium warmingii TaxID=61595 RepID=A0A1H3I238_ALLWA|nr:Predicted site-specific integrase-resolvase [Allochromatium warmingii]
MERRIVCYCRVSSPSQRDDLQRQISYLSERYPEAEVIKDVGSALNYKRKGLKSILGRILRGEKLKIVVAHRDRLARFGFELIEWIVNELGSELVVLNDTLKEPEQELTEDLLTIIHVFSCRLYGLRDYKSKKDKILADERTAKTVKQLVGDLQVHLQRDSVAVEPENSQSEFHGNQEISDSISS